uniref:SET domain-containing protein n=1 Tax=Caenorhabditis tropicalis TaxID=1561998 RepID=A0A1I7T295_9PELO
MDQLDGPDAHENEGNENLVPDDEPEIQVRRPRLKRGASALRPVESSDDEEAEADPPAQPKVPNPPRRMPQIHGNQPLKEDTYSKKKREETKKILKDVDYIANNFPANTCSLRPRNFLKLDEYESDDPETTGSFLPESERKCFVCEQDNSPNGETELISCHGQISGEKRGAERISVDGRPLRICPTRFHLRCALNYNAGSFFLHYAAFPECQGKLLCPLHCCHSCNINHQKQSAYEPDLIECVKCMRAFHLSSCYPAGGRDLDVSIDVDGHKRTFEMIICPAHHVPTPKKKKNRASLNSSQGMEPKVEIRNHLKACSSVACVYEKPPKEVALIQCSKCIQSFHEECLEVKSLDGQPLPAVRDVCERCLCNDDLHINRPVIAYWPMDNKFYLAYIRDWYKYPTSKRNDKNFERLGYAVVEWIDGSDKKIMNIVPVYHLAPLIKKYIELFGKSQKDLWQDVFDKYDEFDLNRCPRAYKLVVSTGKTSKYFDPAIRQKPIDEGEFTNCGCSKKLAQRCVTTDCSNFADDKECPPACEKIGNGCGNRKISNCFIHPNIELRRSGEKGYGVFATDKIPANEFLSEYVGEIIDKPEKKKRLTDIENSKDFQANHYLMEINANWATDATRYGNITRYINHSCDPNSQSYTYGMYWYTRDSHLFYDKRNIIKTLKEIEKDEEITFTYDMEKSEFLPVCLCRSDNCDGGMSRKKNDRRRNDSNQSDDDNNTQRQRNKKRTKKRSKNHKRQSNSKSASGPPTKVAARDSLPCSSSQMPSTSSQMPSTSSQMPSTSTQSPQYFQFDTVFSPNSGSNSKKRVQEEPSLRASPRFKSPGVSAPRLSFNRGRSANSSISSQEDTESNGLTRKSARGRVPKKLFQGE